MISQLLLLLWISGYMDLVSATILFVDNQTMCPWTDPYTVFKEYGYHDDNIPRDLNEYRPYLMHEESVLHLVNHLKQFKLVGRGGNAQVYEGRLKRTGQAVIIKTLTDGGFEELLHEAKIMNYMQQSRYVPRLFGLIPAGPSIDEISMVAEYVENSTSLDDLLLLGDRLSECSWISILQQTTEALGELHRKYILFNDLHMNNVIVSWRGSKPRVHIIDFGHATFRKGKSYSSVNGSTPDKFDFLPPEVWYTISSPASDVFSLGKALEQIMKYINSSELIPIARKCGSVNPKNRPFLQNIMDCVNGLYTEKCLCSNNDTQSDASSVSPDSHMENDLDMVPVPLLSWKSLKMIKFDSNYVWLRYSNQTQILLAKYKPTNMSVVVKMMANVTFDTIRHEAAINYVMSDTGYVPLFLGMAETGASLENICLVQEYFAEGQTLHDILDTIQTLDFTVRIVLALELAEALAYFHKRGLIINNFKTDNILIDFVDSYPVIKLIDIGKCSFHRGYLLGYSKESIQDIEYLAPEIKEHMTSSQASDVYSLGVILRHIFGDNPEVTDIISLCLEESPVVRPSALDVKLSVMKIMSQLLENDV